MLTVLACLVCLLHVGYSNYRVWRVRRQWRELAYTNSLIAEHALWGWAVGVEMGGGLESRIRELQDQAERQLDSTT